MFDTLRLLTQIPDCEGDESNPALAHAYTLKQAESLEYKNYKRPDDMDSGAESASEDEKLILGRNVVPLGSTAAVKTTADATLKTDSESDGEKEDNKRPKDAKKKRKVDNVSKSVASDKKPKLDSHEAGRKAKKPKVAVHAGSAKSTVIKYNDVNWEQELAAILEKSKDDGLVNKLIDFFTTEDGVFHALELLNTTNFDFFECVAQEFILEGNEHVDTAIKLFIDGLLDSSSSVTVEDKDDLDQLWTWFNTTSTRYHAYVCSMKTTPDQKLAEMLAFIDKVADPQMATLKIQPNECYYSTPEGFFKTAAAIYRRFEQEGNQGVVIHPESVFPKVHMIFSNIKDPLKKFYTEHPEYACPGEEYEIIKYKMKKFHFMNVQEDFLPEISGQLERRMMMCFHGMTSAYIKWCVQNRLLYCGVSTYATYGALASCGNSCAFCSKFLHVTEVNDDNVEWAYATPETWQSEDPTPDWFWTKVY